MQKTKKGIEYKVVGSGSPTLVFVHGWCCNTSYWDEQVPYLSKKYQTVTLNLAGHGGSDLAREVMTMQEFGDDVASVINEMNLEESVLIGHSLGGIIILETAPLCYNKPIGLVGVDALRYFEGEMSQEIVNSQLQAMREDFPKGLAASIEGLFHEKDSPEFRERCLFDMSRFSPKLGLNIIKEHFDYLVDKNYLATLDNIKGIPITVIARDVEIPQAHIETNRRYNPAFQAKIIPESGHFLQMSHPEEFNRLLDESVREFIN